MEKQPKLEKLKALRKHIAKTKRSTKSARGNINFVNADLGQFRASRDALKKGTVLSDDVQDRQHRIAELERQISEAEQKKEDLLERQEREYSTLKEAIQLQNACEAWLAEHGIPVPDDNESVHSHAMY